MSLSAERQSGTGPEIRLHTALVRKAKRTCGQSYTFWKYFRNAFARDAWLRIDHLLLSRPVADRLVAAGVDRAARSLEHASDHAPAWIEIADTKSGPPRRGRRVVASARSS
jgi:exodeoxyribonuclease-3